MIFYKGQKVMVIDNPSIYKGKIGLVSEVTERAVWVKGLNPKGHVIFPRDDGLLRVLPDRKFDWE